MAFFVKVALNGARSRSEHPGVPWTPEEQAEAARTSVAAGAQVVHLHAFDESGAETLEAEPCAAVLRAVRAACPGIPISLTTSAAIEPDPERRLQLVKTWTALPDVVSANQGEAGILALCDHLLGRGVGIEAALLHLKDAQAFVKAGIANKCVRVLVEPLDPDPADALAHGAAMKALLAEVGIQLPQVHHGEGIACWAVIERAISRGHGVRVGLEDMTVLPDGRLAKDNADLVKAAVDMTKTP